jgi:hypothetical protein
VSADPRYQAVERQWSECAGRNGYLSAGRAALLDGLRADYDKIVGRIVTRTDGTQHTIRQQAATDPDYQAFQVRERMAATATFPCSRELDRVHAEVYRAHMS